MPTEELKRRGSRWAADRPDQNGPEVVAPDPPDSLDESLHEIWREWATGLAEQGVMTNFDRGSLVLLVEMIGAYENAKALWVEDGKLTWIETKESRIKNPGFVAMNDAWNNLLKAYREFGLTPSSRASVRWPGSKPDAKKKDRTRHLAGPQKVEAKG